MGRKRVISLGTASIMILIIVGSIFFSQVTISASSYLNYSPLSHDFGDMLEGETDSTTFSIWNGGCPCTPLTYTLNESCEWVNVTPISGSSTSEHDVITVTIDTTGLSLGLHSCDISITSNGGSGIFSLEVNIVKSSPSTVYANFSYTPLNPTTNDTIHFIDLSTDSNGYIVNWTWNFDDGNISYEQNPTHRYTDEGGYNVTLTVRDNNSENNIRSKNVTVSSPPNNPPYIPGKPDGSSYGYTGTSYSYSTYATDIEGDKVKYYFDWGDGIKEWTNFVDPGQTVSKSHKWNTPRIYNIKVKAQDEHGVESEWSPVKRVIITVYVPPNQSPTCLLSANPSSGYASLQVNFSISVSDSDGSIISWSLDVDNDGTPESSGTESPPATQQHIYQINGIYTAKLTVTDDDGATGSNTTTIAVSNRPPTANFVYTPSSPVKVGTTLNFTDNSTDADGEIVNCSWDFNDGIIAYGSEVNHTYLTSGKYNITLTARDNDGDKDSYNMTIVVEKGKKEIPGFEFVFLIIAIASLVLMKRKMDKNE